MELLYLGQEFENWSVLGGSSHINIGGKNHLCTHIMQSFHSRHLILMDIPIPALRCVAQSRRQRTQANMRGNGKRNS
ncbi:hypothetical protein VTL71DRAFT_12122 [Oculimacula yallundae]|uniref:Uncharacterized protein n=1 Tax=Oculimacula yallundae TaxID=86028 RepID=A0ABR4CSD1_9HELO